MFKPVSPKVDFPSMERELLKKWYKEGIVEKYLHRNSDSQKRFSFLDGPITANNPMGVHHAWGRMYKDLWQRFYNMRGYRERFQNGFDCQGLWVEVEVEKELGVKTKKDIENLVPGDKNASIAKFVQLCKDRVLKFSEIQTEQSKRLGYFMDWEHSYYTMSDENNYMIWHFLKVCADKGWIYKGHDSVPWCPRCETAISQHEMLTEDYKVLTHESVFLKFPITTSGWENTFLLAWTTTPWTIPANVAIAVHPKFTYALWEHEETKEKLIFLARDENNDISKRIIKNKEVRMEDFVFDAISDKEKFKKIKEISGQELIGLHYQGSFDHLPIVQKAQQENLATFHTVVDGSDIAVATEGTGILHEAPGNGAEDYALAKKENLPVISQINDDASYVADMGEFAGQNAKKHPEIIIDYLKSFGNGKFLLKTMPYTHRYPACWRCKTELVWKVADEWYIAMDKKEHLEGKTFREQMMDVVKQISWHPSWGLDRELDWLKNMHDWLISKKNRYWGLALPIYECSKCRNFQVIGSKEALRERAVDGWEVFEGHSPHKPFIDAVKISCVKCGEVVSRVDDVGNVWLDAGIVPYSTLQYMTDKLYWHEWFPADFVTESFPGQFKNWFYALVAMSTALEKTAPFKNLFGFATMVDEKGEPFHKSKGNSIEFVEAADTAGADVIRWFCARSNPEQNAGFGYHVADQVRRQFHLMVWNIYNFFISNANLDGWEKPHLLESEPRSRRPDPLLKGEGKSNILDEWIVSRLHQTIKKVTESMEKYDAMNACVTIEGFVEDLSLWYVRRSRDRIGVDADNAADKQACYETFSTVLVTLSQLLAPFVPFMADEMYINLTGEQSVHLTDFPEYDKAKINDELEKQMWQIRTVAEMGHAKRKELKLKVRQPLKELRIKNYELRIQDGLINLLKDELNVKNITSVTGEGALAVEFDTAITPELQAEGEARDIVRKIQEERKKLGTTFDEKVKVIIPDYPESFAEYIKKKALVATIEKGEEFMVNKL